MKEFGAQGFHAEEISNGITETRVTESFGDRLWIAELETEEYVAETDLDVEVAGRYNGLHNFDSFFERLSSVG